MSPPLRAGTGTQLTCGPGGNLISAADDGAPRGDALTRKGIQMSDDGGGRRGQPRRAGTLAAAGSGIVLLVTACSGVSHRTPDLALNSHAILAAI